MNISLYAISLGFSLLSMSSILTFGLLGVHPRTVEYVQDHLFGFAVAILVPFLISAVLAVIYFTSSFR